MKGDLYKSCLQSEILIDVAEFGKEDEFLYWFVEGNKSKFQS